MSDLIKAILLAMVTIWAAPRAISEMRFWEKQKTTYRKRTVHEFTTEEGTMYAE